ncbi:hypothetical protein [Shewanella sp.]|uniref:hypothetical protein n=1 Tax=Shewanella sp. TaxID=50422 RepID=UPI0035616C9B
MKIVALILLVLVGVFLYNRAKRLANEEQQPRRDSSEDGNTMTSAPKVSDTNEIEAEKAAVPVSSETVEEIVDKKALQSEADEAAVVAAPQSVEVEPATEAASVEADTDADVSAKTEAVCEIETLVGVVAREEAAEKARAGLALPDFAGEVLTRAVSDYNGSSTAELKHQSLLIAINECYKQRKDAGHLAYGASLAQHYAKLAIEVLGMGKPLKGIGFMQLATLQTDNGEFNSAIELCRQALEHGLSDGTVTGFEGRIARIEKARDKAAG